MKQTICEAATVEEAVAKAAAELNVEASALTVEVLREPVKKLFGGVKAQVKCTAKEEGEAGGNAAADAQAYLRAVLSGLGYTAFELETKEEEDITRILVKGEGFGAIIGRRGETLDALQYLTSLVANRHPGTYRRLSIDIGDYREHRTQTLQEMARRLAAGAVKSGRRVSLEPMNPFERRVIHTAVQDVPGAESWSVGSENARHVVIGPAGSSHAAGAEDDGAQMEYFGGHGGRGHGYGGGHGGQGGGHRGRRGGRGHGDPGRGQGGGDREFRGNDTSGTSIAGGEFRGSGADVFAGDVFANVPWQVQGERSQNDRVVNNRVMDERGAGERPQRTERGARPQAMRPQGNRPQGNREHSEHPQRAERPAGDRVAGDRIAERPQRTYDANGVPQREPRVVREFVSRSAPRAFAEDEVPGKTESEKEATTALYGRIDL